MSAAPQRVPYSVAARELLRNTLLDAACHELQARHWADITMADIAVAAGVSRQTLYKEFGSREEFAQILVMREAETLPRRRREGGRPAPRRPRQGSRGGLRPLPHVRRREPAVRAIVVEEGAEELLALFTTQGKPLVERAADRLTAVVIAGWPLIRRRDAELLGDVLVRLAISYAALPNGEASATAASVSSLFEPYVEKLVREGTS